MLSEYYALRKENPVDFSDFYPYNPPILGKDSWLENVFSCCEEARYLTHPSDLETLTGRIKEGLLGWIQTGVYAYTVRRYRLYKFYYKSWREYCEKELGKGHGYINRLIQAARVVKELAEYGFNQLPTNESQARLLTKFFGEDLAEQWKLCISEHLPCNITAKTIEATLKGEPVKENKRLEVPLKSWDKFERKAKDVGLEATKVLDELMNEWEPEDVLEETDLESEDEIKEITEEDLEFWQEDLKRLVQEKDNELNWFAKLILWRFYEQFSYDL